MPGKIFISYRRDDARADARGLHDQLQRAFGKPNVFMDVDNLLPGQRFEDELDSALSQCDVLLAVIGSRWLSLLSERQDSGSRDHVREEIAAALARRIVVIPVLIDDAKLPAASELPDDIRDLVSYQKHDISHEKFSRDADELIEAIKIVSKAQEPDVPKPSAGSLIGIAAVGLLVVAGGLYFSGMLTNRGAGPGAVADANKPSAIAAPASEKPAKAAESFAKLDANKDVSEKSNGGLKQSAVGDVKTFRDCADVCPEMIRVPAGSFTMGDQSGDPEEKPERKVTFEKPFALGKYEVTWDEWDACVKDGVCQIAQAEIEEAGGDEGWGRGRRPVVNVSWKDANKYVAWLSLKTGKAYRLPTEAEWEYAARSGTQKKYSWGDAVGQGHANCDGCGSKWDKAKTAPVGSFKPNAFGIHDLHGNVLEWVQDCWHLSYRFAPRDGKPWTEGCNGPTDRAIRGGSWKDAPALMRVTYRSFLPEDYRYDFMGFRVALTLE